MVCCDAQVEVAQLNLIVLQHRDPLREGKRDSNLRPVEYSGCAQTTS